MHRTRPLWWPRTGVEASDFRSRPSPPPAVAPPHTTPGYPDFADPPVAR